MPFAFHVTSISLVESGLAEAPEGGIASVVVETFAVVAEFPSASETTALKVYVVFGVRSLNIYEEAVAGDVLLTVTFV